MMSDGTPHACPKEAVVPDEMSGDAADHRSFYAARRLGWAGRKTDNGKHRGCRNEHRLHEHLLKTGWISHWPVEPPFDGHLNPATALKGVCAVIRANGARSANTPHLKSYRLPFARSTSHAAALTAQSHTMQLTIPRFPEIAEMLRITTGVADAKFYLCSSILGCSGSSIK
jgi:hypothetical protein